MSSILRVEAVLGGRSTLSMPTTSRSKPLRRFVAIGVAGPFLRARVVTSTSPVLPRRARLMAAWRHSSPPRLGALFVRRAFSCSLARAPTCSTVIGRPRVPASRPAMWAAKLPLALSSTASSRRSRLATKPFGSNSSRSSRAFSSLPSGSRASAQRSIGGIAMVVITAMATIMREQVLAEHAHRQTDGGDDDLGRAARVHAAGQRQRFPRASVRRACRRRRRRRTCRSWRSAIRPSGQQQQVGILQHGEVGAQARRGRRTPA